MFVDPKCDVCGLVAGHGNSCFKGILLDLEEVCKLTEQFLEYQAKVSSDLRKALDQLYAFEQRWAKKA